MAINIAEKEWNGILPVVVCMYVCMYLLCMSMSPLHMHRIRFTCTVGIVLLLIAIAQLFPDFE